MVDTTLGETLRLSDERKQRKADAGPRPFLYVVMEVDRPSETPSRHTLHDVDEVVIGRGPVRSAERSVDGGVRRLTLRVPDRWMSSTHARLGKVLGRWVLGDARSKNGTIVNGVRSEHATLADGDLVELGHTFLLFRSVLGATGEEAPDQTGGALLGDETPPGLSTLVPPLARGMGMLAQMAASTVSMIVHGESGTGKELIARAIHQISGRPGPFVAVNCGALPDTLVETELFGYKKGAFSGATEDRPGLVRASDRGTLFLDEIGDLPASSQAAFLRVLQEYEVMPVGGTRAVPVDLRVVAATHRDLAKMVDEGKFRGDLYARLSGYTLTLPPLRERLEDLGLLVAALLRRLEPERVTALSLSLDAARALFRYDWPLNVRELEKCLEAACVLARAGVIELDFLPESVREALSLARPAGSLFGGSDVVGANVTPPMPLDAAGPATPSPDREREREPGPLTEEERQRCEQLVALFKEHKGNVSAVARALGKARMQVQRWMKRYAIDPDQYK